MKKVIAILLALIMLLGLAACGSSDGKQTESQTPDDSGKKLTILVMPKLVGIPWFNASDVGAVRAGEELGVNVIYAGPTQADAAEQVKMIEDSEPGR